MPLGRAVRLQRVGKGPLNRAVAALLAILLGSCRDRVDPAPVTLAPGERRVSSPAASDLGSECVDVGERRVCWDGEKVLAVPRPLPERASSERGWRCSGAGAQRTCIDRALGSDAFVCRDDVCSQHYPRMPDDGEWECADIEGAVICHGGQPAAGVVAGPADPAWICGARKGVANERVCVDFAPDRPPREAFGDCRFQYEPGRARRICKRGAARIGASCTGSECPAGTTCTGGHCLPLRARPSCWVGSDCKEGACVLATCR